MSRRTESEERVIQTWLQEGTDDTPTDEIFTDRPTVSPSLWNLTIGTAQGAATECYTDNNTTSTSVKVCERKDSSTSPTSSSHLERPRKRFKSTEESKQEEDIDDSYRNVMYWAEPSQTEMQTEMDDVDTEINTKSPLPAANNK